MLALVLAVQAATSQGPAHHGREGDLTVRPPRLAATVVVDGVLDEPVWEQAAVLTGFSQYRPVDGRPAQDSTDVHVWYGPSAIFFGVRAFEPHGRVRASLADRDRIESDDFVQILLDTFDDRRTALVFGVNPLGVQADGVRTEGSEGAAGGPGAGGRLENVDMNPDFVYQSAGRLTPFGYEVEIRIPFKSMRFPATETQQWAINVIRKIQHSGYEDTWTPAERANASFLAQSGVLTDLTELHRGLVLDLNPFATGRVLGAPDSLGDWRYDATPEFGLNASWGITNNLSLDATINPDFSQVEADVGQVTVNERFAIFFPEKRPFFLEGIEQFNTPNSLIYTRRIRNPVAGAKVTGKVSGTNVAVLSVVDDRGASASGSDRPIINAVRIRRDIGGQSTAGLAYTDRVDGDDFNRVAAADVHLVFAKLYFFEAQLGGSVTRQASTTVAAPIWNLAFDRTGRHWGFRYAITGIDPGFQAGTGFVNRTGIVSPFIANRLSTYGRPGSTLESWTGFFVLSGTWDYDGFFDGNPPLETSVANTSYFTLRGGWNMTLRPSWETVAFDPALYDGYALGGPDTTAFAIPQRVNDLVQLQASIGTPQFDSFAAEAGATVGRTAAFFEPAPAKAFSFNATLDWRPTDQLRLQTRYVYTVLERIRDGTRLSTAHIPRLKVEYQLSRPIFFRFVGQYQSQEQDALRDPPTERPILLDDGAGGFRPADPRTENDLRVDWLFSLRPNPGTVVFAGYGSSLTEPDSFAFRDLRRVRDGFFMKVSYLFRL